jgi:hypothetical protein
MNVTLSVDLEILSKNWRFRKDLYIISNDKNDDQETLLNLHDIILHRNILYINLRHWYK